MASPATPAAPAAPVECDILVIGGGPAGSTAATLLARRGWRVRRRQPGVPFNGDTQPEGSP